MVAQAGVLALPNGIGRNYSRVIGSSAYNNVRSPFQRFHIRLYPHLGYDMNAVVNILFRKSISGFEIFYFPVAKRLNDFLLVQLCVDPRYLRVDIQLLYDFIQYPHGPIQMRCGSRTARRPNQNRNMCRLSCLDDQFQIPFDHRPRCKAFPRPQIIRPRVYRPRIQRNDIKSMFQRRF